MQKQGRSEVGAGFGVISPGWLRARLLVLAVAAGVFALAWPWPAGVAMASVPVGKAEITTGGLTTPLHSGGSATEFGVILPQGASCPGDTAHDGYHVFSYLVPQDVAPPSVSFKGIIPGEYYGFTALGEYYYGAADTAPDTGLVVDIPAFFVFSRLTPGDLFPPGEPSALWDGGIACTNVKGTVTNYWNAVFKFSASSSDPGGFTWSVEDPAEVAGSGGPGVSIWLSLVIVGALLTAAGLVFRMGQRAGKVSKAVT